MKCIKINLYNRIIQGHYDNVIVVYLLTCKYVHNKKLNNHIYGKVPFSQENNEIIIIANIY